MECRNVIGLALLLHVIGLKNSRQFSPIKTNHFDCLAAMSVSFGIGYSDGIGFGFTTPH